MSTGQTLERTEPPGEHARGGGADAVRLTVYGDYQCPYTRAAYRNIQRLERRLGERLRFAFRHFPLTEIHPHAQAAAEAAEAAGAQGRFWPMHDLLFRRQGALEAADLRAYAEELELGLDQFDLENARHLHAPRVERDAASGRRAGVHGTPTLFLESELYLGSYDARELGPTLEELAQRKDRDPTATPEEVL